MQKLLVVLILLVGATFAWAQGGAHKKKLVPADYGRVTIDNYSQQAGMPPVIFDHWVHRSKFTCRLCHVDIGFVMKAGETKIHANDIMNGLYCGVCHNGKSTMGRTVFPACAKDSSTEEFKVCARCHQLEPNNAMSEKFMTFSRKMPTERFGNGINWEKAEREGKIALTDYIEGVSAPRFKLNSIKEMVIKGKVAGMPDIIFSHTKHTVWNGCELCHPDIFGIKKGGTPFTMDDIFKGKSCGTCHNSVAFPLTDCQRCHSLPVGG